MTTQEKLPQLPSEDRLQLKVSDNVKHKYGYKSDKEALSDRHYQDGVQIPVLPAVDLLPVNERKDILLAVYGQICNDWRSLTDVRFKLLGLLPLVSGTVLITLLSQSDGNYQLAGAPQVLVGLFGLVVTLGLFIYDKRNSTLYNDLIGRARQIENELIIHTGHFRGRPIGSKLINHSVGLNTVYFASIIAWMAIIVHGIYRLFCSQ